MGSTKQRENSYEIQAPSPASTFNSDDGSLNKSEAKRKRASKPKVRTGCVTCKIRRVKCDEQKPACLRCTSTGRTCDGYGGPVPPRKKDPPAFARQKQSQASSKHEEGAHGSSFRGLRTLAADTDIPETETEPEPDGFHDVRIAPTANLPFHASDNDPAVSSFWQQDLVPQQFGSTHQAYHRHPFPDYLPGPDTSEMVLVPGEPFGLVPRCYDDLPALEQTLDSFLVENGHWMYPVSRRP